MIHEGCSVNFTVFFSINLCIANMIQVLEIAPVVSSFSQKS